MRKYLSSMPAFLLVAALALLLIACQPDEIPPEYEMVASSGLPEDDAAQEHEENSGQGAAQGTGAKGELRALNIVSALSGQNKDGAAPNGFYSVEDIDDLDVKSLEMGVYPSRIYYTDYATRQKKIMCDIPSCEHKDNGCIAWLPITAHSIFAVDDGLVLVNNGSNIFDDNDENPKTIGRTDCSITYMDYEGKNRRELLSYSNDWFGNVWLTDDEYFYGERISEPLEGEDIMYDVARTIFKVNIKTGEVTDITKLEPLYENVFGAHGNEIFITNVKWEVNPRTIADNDDEAWENNHETASITMTALDVKTGEKRTLENEYSMQYSSMLTIYDGWLYYMAMAKNSVNQTFMRENLATGKTEILIEGRDNTQNSVSKIIDGRILFYQYYSVVKNEEFIEQSEKYYSMPVAGGLPQDQTLTMKLSAYFEEEGYVEYEEPLLIVSEAGDCFYVVSDYVNDEKTEEAEEQIASVAPVYSLILKEDYWAGNANYIPITMVN